MRLRNFLCTLAVLFSLVGQGSLIAPRDAAADLIINRPFSGKRAIELNIHGSAYYDSGLGGGRPCYNWNNGNGNNFCGYGTQTVSPVTYPYGYPNSNLNRTMKLYGADLDPSATGSGTTCAPATC